MCLIKAKLAEADDPRQQQIAKRRINDLQQAMMLNNKLKPKMGTTPENIQDH